jgi:hypothetical protein
VVATEIINPKRLQSTDPGDLLGLYLKKLTPASEKLMQAMTEAGIDTQQGGMTNLKDIKFTVEEKSSTEAVVTIDNAGKKQSSDWVQIDGRWVAKDLVKEWDTTMQKARASINRLTIDQTQAIEQMKMFDSQFIAKFEAVKTQQELDAMILPMMMMAGPMMQQMGGGGMPGGGLPPPAFGPDPNLPVEQ